VAQTTHVDAARNIAFEAFGVRIRVAADTDHVLERITALLPPGAQPCPPSTVDDAFGVLADVNGSYQFTRGDSPVTTGIDLDLAFLLLENQLRISVARHAPGRIFVHAGVVAHEGRALVIPGRSFTGKTTLVMALVRAGAIYYSDEFAVLDPEGFVHPYARALTVRDENEVQVDHEVGSLGGVAGDEPVPVGAVVVSSYVSGSEWAPTAISPGQCALAMLSNTVAAIDRAEEAMAAIGRAVAGAVLLEGDRGDADSIAGELLEVISRSDQVGRNGPG
jgi:hypothetical protein